MPLDTVTHIRASSDLRQFALAPPGVSVKPGVCCSFCGNGPVVVDNANKKKYKRVVSGTAKVVDLVSQNGGLGETLTSMQQAILDGYDVITQANDALAKKDFAAAESLYESTYRIDQAKSETQGPVAPPRGLQWLIHAYQGQARAQSKMGNVDAAVVLAHKACDLSLNLSPEALEILQEMYQVQGNVSAELSALLLYFDLPEPEKATTVVSNKRRQLGFRRAKLEREVNGAS
jgi:tetratricopeptide (TPR) repeat protein